MVDVINALKSDKKVYVIAAPATEGQFGANITMGSWKKAMQEVGFNGFIEAGLGGDMTAASEAAEWVEAYKAGEKKVTSCCPGFVNMVRLHFPEMADKISTTISPMCAVSRMIKAQDPDAVTVFVGPCVAKKSEVVDQKIEGNADYVLTYSEMRAIMSAKGVELQPSDTSYQESSVYGKRFANSGGVTAAVVESMKEMEAGIEPKVCKANGAAECRKFLMLMKAGKLPDDFIEGMACEGGCVGGSSSFNDMLVTKKFRDELLQKADDRQILDNLKNYHMETFSMHREEEYAPCMPRFPMNSGCFVEIAPRPITVVTTGTCVFSTTSRNTSCACAMLTPPPARNSGRFAFASIFSARFNWPMCIFRSGNATTTASVTQITTDRLL